MATGTTPVVPAGTRMHQRGGRAGFTGALRSEFTKIRSVRPTYWSLITLIVVTVGIGAAAGASAAHSGSGQLGASFDPTQTSLYGLVLSQLIIAVLGVLTVTSEYSTGMMRTSLTSMPRRGTMIAAKAVVLATVALVTGLVASFGAFFIGQGLMSGHHIGATLGQPHVLRAVIGGALFLTVSGLLGLGLGLILRHAAAAISAVVGLLFVLFILALQLPSSWHVSTWIPQRLERERDASSALAAAVERARIAREMHDSVAHHLTVIVALSDGALAAVTREPAHAADAIRDVSSTARQALAETRRLLGVLRAGSGQEPRQPLPSLADLDDLLGRVRAAGLPVRYERSGTGADPPPGIRLAVFRLVQEALTNTMKHAGPGVSAAVRLRIAPDEVDIEVEDDGAGRVGDSRAPGGGLTGMRERISAFGGELDCGPRQPRGWRVTAHLDTADAS